MTGLREACSRGNSMNPVFLPILNLPLLEFRRDRHRPSGNILLRCASHARHALKFMREDFNETWQCVRPVVEDPLRPAASRQRLVARDEIFDQLNIASLHDRFKINRSEVAAFFGKVSLVINHVSNAAAHAGSEIASAGAEHNNESVGHVFATVVANAFNDRGGSGVADRETLTSHTVEKCFATGCAIKSDVANQNIFFCRKGGFFWRMNDDAPAGKPFADVIICIAFERERYAFGKKRSKALSG